MEKNIKIITRKLNQIGKTLGYPFYIYGDGASSALRKNETPVVTVSAPLGITELQDPAAYASVAEKYTPALAGAQPLDYLYEDGSISPKRLNYPVAGIIGWKSPDPATPVGRRALCFAFYGWKYDEFIANEDFCPANVICNRNINLPNGAENTATLEKLAETAGISLLAVEHCRGLETGGLKKGDCFLPSQNEIILAAPVFEGIVNRVENLEFGRSEKVKNRRFGLNSELLKNFVFTSVMFPPGKIECYMHIPSQPLGKFCQRDLNAAACIAPAFWI